CGSSYVKISKNLSGRLDRGMNAMSVPDILLCRNPGKSRRGHLLTQPLWEHRFQIWGMSCFLTISGCQHAEPCNSARILSLALRHSTMRSGSLADALIPSSGRERRLVRICLRWQRQRKGAKSYYLPL